MAHPRRAFLCTHKDCVPPIRVFLRPDEPEPPSCPEHGATMIKQINVPYTRPDTSKPIGAPKVNAAQAKAGKRAKR